MNSLAATLDHLTAGERRPIPILLAGILPKPGWGGVGGGGL